MRKNPLGSTHLQYLLDPPAHVLLKGIQERGVGDGCTQFLHCRPPLGFLTTAWRHGAQEESVEGQRMEQQTTQNNRMNTTQNSAFISFSKGLTQAHLHTKWAGPQTRLGSYDYDSNMTQMQQLTYQLVAVQQLLKILPHFAGPRFLPSCSSPLPNQRVAIRCIVRSY